MPESTTRDTVFRLLKSQTTGVLATEKEHRPYANLVAFSYTDDLKRIIFVTPTDTTKYRNLSVNPRVSMIVDVRKNDPADFSGSMAVTVLGQAREIIGDEKAELMPSHSERLPGLSGFIDSHAIALFQIEVDVYILAQGLTEISLFMPGDGRDDPATGTA